MKSTTAFGVLALVASAAAHEHRHEKFHHRDVASSGACQVEYHTVTSYGEWGLVPVSSAPASSSSSAPPPPPPSTSSSSSVAVVSSSSSAPPPPPPSTSSSPPPPPPTTSSTPPPPPPTTSSTPPPPPPTTTSTPQPETTTQAPAYHYKAAVDSESSAAAPSPAPAPSTSSNSGTAGTISANGNKWAFCYTPYTSDGNCKTADQVSSDIAELKGKGFTTIRTYAADCSGLDNIGAAVRANGLKMVVGINIDKSGIGAYTDAQLSTTLTWGEKNWDIVVMLVVGNEAIFNGWTTANNLATLITHVKAEAKIHGYNGPVTTTEPLNVIEANGAVICPVVDVIGANIHPFFDTSVSALLAGPFVAKQLGDLAGVCNNQKEAYILETGWPTAGDSNGLAIPGFDAQKIAIDGIMGLVGSKAAVFSFGNDNWKAPGALGVEQHWGCASLFH